MGSTAPTFPAMRCFPFLSVKRAPSYRQRKRSLGSARDDDTGRTRFPRILCMMHGIAIPHAVISSAARNLFRPLFPPPSLSRLWETPSPFRDTVFPVSCYQTCTINPKRRCEITIISFSRSICRGGLAALIGVTGKPYPSCLSCHSHPIRHCGAPSPRGEGCDTRIPSSKKGGEAATSPLNPEP